MGRLESSAGVRWLRPARDRTAAPLAPVPQWPPLLSREAVEEEPVPHYSSEAYVCPPSKARCLLDEGGGGGGTYPFTVVGGAGGGMCILMCIRIFFPTHLKHSTSGFFLQHPFGLRDEESYMNEERMPPWK